MVKHAGVVAEIRQVCRLGLPGREVVPLVLEVLHRLVPSYTNLFDWVDENGQISDYYTEGPYAPEAARLYFDEFYNKREREVIAPFSEQVRRAGGVINRGIRDRAFYGSDFYNLIWRPRGVHHNLEAVVRHHDRPVGALTLYRSAKDAPFSEHDEQALACVVPHLAHAVATSADYRGHYLPSGAAGLLVVDSGGSVIYLSAEGRRLLYLARRSTADTPSEAADAEELVLSDALLDWCRALAGTPRDESLPVFRQQNAWGKFVFRSHWLEPSDTGCRLIAIEIERHLPVSLKVARAMQALPLSVRQRELCALLAQGLSYAAIAGRMNITTHTAISYARLVYEKLGLGGRDELAEKLLAPAMDA